VNLPAIYSRLSRGGDADAHAVALDRDDGDANVMVTDDLLAMTSVEKQVNRA
jgi:hypothetical protein